MSRGKSKTKKIIDRKTMENCDMNTNLLLMEVEGRAVTRAQFRKIVKERCNLEKFPLSEIEIAKLMRNRYEKMHKWFTIIDSED